MARVRGAKQVKAAIRRAPKRLQDEALKEVRASTRDMHSDVKAGLNAAAALAPFHHGGVGMQSITGIFRRNYRWSVSRRSLKGRVGFLGPTTARRVFYAFFFFYGTKNQPARPVHDLAFEKQKPIYEANQVRAMDRVLRELF